MTSILKLVIPLQDRPEFVETFSRLVSESVGMVCEVCGLERMGHGPESIALGFERHPWAGRVATGEEVTRAHELTSLAYRKMIR